jgi:hypothetical protein
LVFEGMIAEPEIRDNYIGNSIEKYLGAEIH